MSSSSKQEEMDPKDKKFNKRENSIGLNAKILKTVDETKKQVLKAKFSQFKQNQAYNCYIQDLDLSEQKPDPVLVNLADPSPRFKKRVEKSYNADKKAGKQIQVENGRDVLLNFFVDFQFSIEGNNFLISEKERKKFRKFWGKHANTYGIIYGYSKYTAADGNTQNGHTDAHICLSLLIKALQVDYYLENGWPNRWRKRVFTILLSLLAYPIYCVLVFPFKQLSKLCLYVYYKKWQLQKGDDLTSSQKDVFWGIWTYFFGFFAVLFNPTTSSTIFPNAKGWQRAPIYPICYGIYISLFMLVVNNVPILANCIRLISNSIPGLNSISTWIVSVPLKFILKPTLAVTMSTNLLVAITSIVIIVVAITLLAKIGETAGMCLEEIYLEKHKQHNLNANERSSENNLLKSSKITEQLDNSPKNITNYNNESENTPNKSSVLHRLNCFNPTN